MLYQMLYRWIGPLMVRPQARVGGLVVFLVIAKRVHPTEAQQGMGRATNSFLRTIKGVGAEVLRGDMVDAGTFLVWLRQG